MNNYYLIATKYRKLLTLVMSVLIIVTSLVSSVYSQEATDSVHNSLETLAANIKSYAGVLCVICAIYVGLMFVLSAINPKLKDNAKGGLWGLLFGVIILLYSDKVAYFISELIGADSRQLDRR